MSFLSDTIDNAQETVDDATDTVTDPIDDAADDVYDGVTNADQSPSGNLFGGGGSDDPDPEPAPTPPRDSGMEDSDGTPGGLVDRLTGGATDAADSVNDSLDDAAEAAGNLADPSETADFVPGATELSESEEIQAEREKFQNSGILGKIDAGTAAGMSLLLDNPEGSVQDTNRDAIEAATGLSDEEQAERAQDIDEGVTSGIDSLVEGTIFDNAGTDAVRAGGDMLFGELVRTGVGATTGIDSEEGDTEARTGALEVADIGLTVGTAGVGRAGAAALRGSDEAGGLLSRTLGRGGDDAAQVTDDLPALSGSDDLARTADEVTETAENLPALSGSDDVARFTDDAAGAADDAAGAADDTIRMTQDADGVFSMAGRSADDAGRAGGETAQAASRAADEGASLADRIGAFTSRVGDSLTGVGDDAAAAASRGASRSRGVLDDVLGGASRAGSRAGRAARNAPGRAGRAARNRPITTAGVGAAGAAIAGGAAHQKLFGGADEVELTDEDGETFYILREGTFEPTQARPNGGVLWAVEQNGSRQGFTVVLSVEGQDVTLLGADGGEMKSTMEAEQFKQAAERAQNRANENSAVGGSA